LELRRFDIGEFLEQPTRRAMHARVGCSFDIAPDQYGVPPFEPLDAFGIESPHALDRNGLLRVEARTLAAK
jgi:hypothetical protein